MIRMLVLMVLACVACRARVELDEPERGPERQTPYDALFIDSMIEHHRGALAMAEAVSDSSSRPELAALAAAIVESQTAEIDSMLAWRARWYPELEPTGGLGMSMGDMAVAPGDGPWDLRFLEAMISHHRGAVQMAGEAVSMAEHAELRTLAGAIVSAQQAEIAMMEDWMTLWSAE